MIRENADHDDEVQDEVDAEVDDAVNAEIYLQPST